MRRMADRAGGPKISSPTVRAKQQFKRLLSYASARWGASPAILSWELMNEIDLAKYTWPDDVDSLGARNGGALESVPTRTAIW